MSDKKDVVKEEAKEKKTLKQRVAELSDSISEEDANMFFLPICGTAFGIHLTMFLLGIILKRMFVGIQAISMLVGIIMFVLICPKLKEHKQSTGFLFMQLYPPCMIAALFSAPIMKLSRKMVAMGMSGKISLLSLLVILVTSLFFAVFYFTDKGETGKNIVGTIKEQLKVGFGKSTDCIERPGDVQLCICKETGEPEIWHYKDRFLHMLILGPTGSGKTSQTILPLVNQDIQNMEAGVTVLEPKGDFAQKAAMMAEHYGRPYLYFDPSFKNCPFFNPMSGKESDVVENMATTFRMLNPDSPQFFLDLNEQLMRNAVKVLKRLDRSEGVDGRHATLVELSRLLQNSAGVGRQMVVQFSQISAKTQEEAKENSDIASWFLNDYFEERSKVYENTSGVRSQVAKLVSNEYLRTVLNPDYDAGQRNQIDFDKHLAEGGVICICTAQGVLRDLGRFLGYFIILQLQSAVFRRPGNEDTRRAHFLYIDEFQTYSNPGFSDMLTQGRSYRVACHLATQARAQMAMGGGKDGKNFVELVSTNARNIIFYPGCSKDDAKYYSEQFGEYEKVETQVGYSRKKFNLITGGMDKLGHPTETIREAKKMTARFSPSDLIFRPFGEIVYCIIKKNNIQLPQVGEISYIPKDLNDKLDKMITAYIEANSWAKIEQEEQARLQAGSTEAAPSIKPKNTITYDENTVVADPAAKELEQSINKTVDNKAKQTIPDEAMEDRHHYDAPVEVQYDPVEDMTNEPPVESQENVFEDTYMDDASDDAENDWLL